VPRASILQWGREISRPGAHAERGTPVRRSWRPNIKTPPIPGWGRAVSNSWYHPTSPHGAAVWPLPTIATSYRGGPGNGGPLRRRLLGSELPFGAMLRGLIHRRSWSRITAHAVLWPVSAGNLSSLSRQVLTYDYSLRESSRDCQGRKYQKWPRPMLIGSQALARLNCSETEINQNPRVVNRVGSDGNPGEYARTIHSRGEGINKIHDHSLCSAVDCRAIPRRGCFLAAAPAGEPQMDASHA